MWRKHRDELEADFLQFYGIDIYELGKGLAPTKAARLAVQLPLDSRCTKAICPELQWGQQEYLLAAIEYDLRLLVWMNSEDGRKGLNRPKPIDTPLKQAQLKQKIEKTDFDRIDRILGMSGGE